MIVRAGLGFCLALLSLSSACSRVQFDQAAQVSSPTASGSITQGATAHPSPRTPVQTNTAGPSPTVQEVKPSETATIHRDPVNPPTLAPSPTLTTTLTVEVEIIPSRTTSPTPAPRLPHALVQIQNPGNYSRLASPIQLEASLIPGSTGTVFYELIGEDGRLLMKQVKRYLVKEDQRIWITNSIDFEIPGVAETARIRVYVEDRFGRLVGLSSVDLVLLSIGDSEVFPAGDHLEPFAVQNPRPDQAVEGGKLAVTGYARPLNKQPIILELIGNSGEIVGSRQIKLEPAEDGKHQYFQTELPYRIQASTWARLVIRQSGERIPGAAAAASRMVYLRP